MVACVLEGHGIEVFLADDNVCRILPQAALIIGGVKVLVSPEDLEDAVEVLKLACAGSAPFIGGTLTVPLSLFAIIAAWLLRGRGKKPDEKARAAVGTQLQ
jgi:hypothetical protein